MEVKQELPNATTTLILGISSLITCFCYGIPGLILSIIALIVSKNSKKLHLENPDMYTGYENLRIGRICAIVGLILSSIYALFILLYFIFLGSMFLLLPESQNIN
ncbi:CCC motif membrane protein [Aquimarina algicola]|uniref:DUF4190 domain-containing protein n=1 Tax=Aquimarina algicola TaxID=2589995 RepID=A0A504J851_9FLAO|nr:CCC motif membrane protein [Aquimarina algicola]TPN82351.1 DUF4190 domain-containing protein [Aquimarina algicola]